MEGNSALTAKAVMVFSCKFLFGCKRVQAGYVQIILFGAEHNVNCGYLCDYGFWSPIVK